MAKQNTQFDAAIIGAGIVGLATGLKLVEKSPGLKVCIIEKESAVAVHQTGNNSGVIHSGIYYRPGSLKAKNCRDGINELLSFCDQNDIPYKLSGKLIVALQEEELPRLEDLYQRGVVNQVPDLRLIEKEEIREIEPYVNGIRAIHSPVTGVVDYKVVAEKMLEMFQSLGGRIFFTHKVSRIEERADECIIITNHGEIFTSLVVNCAGLFSDRVAETVQESIGIKIIPFRGEYYTLSESASDKVNSLIYPVPDPKFPFLGVHFTRDIYGKVEAGPNAVLALAREGYRKSDFRLNDIIDTFTYKGFWKLVMHYWKTGSAEQIRSLIKPLFVIALQKMIPDIQSDDLETGGAGVRAQALTPDGKLVDDFYVIESERSIHVLNAPSPAATASLAIGKNIADRIVRKKN